MAHIFKEPTESAKGIIVFTHKEFSSFSKRLKVSKSDLFRPSKLLKKQLSSLSLKHKFESKLEDISKNYYIGVHWGSYSKDIYSPKWVDFHMTAKGTTTFVNHSYIIPLNSANFTPRVMKNENEKKYWDIICVAKNDNKKNYPQLMKAVRRIYDSGYNYKILFIIASNINEAKNSYYTNILDDYYKLFTAKERENFTIIKTHPETGFQGFSYTFLSHLYNQSKVFTIFSQREGECRVIKEAQLCGLPIVVKSDLEGGGRDYLNSKNSVYFDNYEKAHEALIYTVKNYSDFRIETTILEQEIGEMASILKLHSSFNILYEKNSEVYDEILFNTDNLNRRLPAHYFDESISWASENNFRFSTADIVSSKMFSDFCSELKSES
ncbi:glycosyltransferase [Psychrobacter sp. LV10R520-6]|uniref:glycosyltransferase n=1 Tax=Psychrobacter sp. LV10R520-6 TaxID=1415574 RepID=UPI0024CD38B4|nr:glycosyltransferase [Psychrobacter sp. LV10R520-6]SNT69258.1 Glycosyl transferases group 1 [Psychrobacter sp. LV10R520-6]